MKTTIRIAGLMSGISLLATASAAMAQDAPEPEAQEVVVIGSQIKGADVAGALPVTVLNEDDIAATAATSGDDLFRSIPQAGDVGALDLRADDDDLLGLRLGLRRLRRVLRHGGVGGS